MMKLRISRIANSAIFATVFDRNEKERLLIAKAVPDGVYVGDYLQKVVSDLSGKCDMLFVGDGVPTNFWDATGEEGDINEAVSALFNDGFTFGGVYG